jgi:hypothetical protein
MKPRLSLINAAGPRELREDYRLFRADRIARAELLSD